MFKEYESIPSKVKAARYLGFSDVLRAVQETGIMASFFHPQTGAHPRGGFYAKIEYDNWVSVEYGDMVVIKGQVVYVYDVEEFDQAFRLVDPRPTLEQARNRTDITDDDDYFFGRKA